MDTLLIAQEAPTVPAEKLFHLTEEWEKQLSPKTRADYYRDLADFARFMGRESRIDAMRDLVSLAHAEANLKAYEYKNHLVAQRVAGSNLTLSPSTVNRRLTALKSLLGFFRMMGLIPWSLEVKGLRYEPRRDMSGPGDVIGRLLRAADPSTLKGLRDRLIVRFAYSMLLRRSSITGIDIEDLDIGAGKVAVKVKRHREKMTKRLPPNLARELKAYLAVRRNPTTGPLFINVDRAGKGDGRLTGEGVRLVLLALSKKAKVGVVRPHGLRHQGATDLSDKKNGNLVYVKAAGDWADFRTPSRYIDRIDKIQPEAYRILDVNDREEGNTEYGKQEEE